MRVKMFLSGYLISIALSLAAKQPVVQPLPRTFDEFVSSSVAREQREDFRAYYVKKIKELDRRSDAKKKKQFAQLKKEAHHALEVHHPHWAHEVVALLSDDGDQQKQHDNFLVWYGAYMQYLRHNATSKGTMWTKLHIKKDAVVSKVNSYFAAFKERKHKSGAHTL